MSANRVVEINSVRPIVLDSTQPLTSADREKICQEHWLTNADLDAAHVTRVNDATGRELTGWMKRNCSGIYIPYPTLDGRNSYYFRIRRDVPDMTIQLDGSTKISRKYAAPYGSRNYIYFPAGVTPAHLSDATIPVIVTEGEYKAMALWRLANHKSETPRFIPIGLGGVDSWQGRNGKTPLPDGTTTDSYGLIPDMFRVTWAERNVIIAFDSDWKRNTSVRAAKRRLSDELKTGGAKVVTLSWEERDGKGIDDWLATVGPDPVLAAINGINWDITTGWLSLLQVDDKGKPVKNVLNVVTALTLAPEWEGVIAYNQFTAAIQTVTPPPFGDKHRSRSVLSPNRQDWTDADDIHASMWLQSKGLNVSKEMASDAIHAIADLTQFHVIRDYLNSLSWDGDKRIDTWLQDYMGADPSAYLSKVGKMWLISAVARVFNPGCQVDHMMVFKGSQGRGKSTALSALCGDDWFSDNLPNKLHEKDASQHLSGKWIIEIGELSQMKSNEVEEIKLFVSRKIDKYRPSYGRRDCSFPRQCVFAASTNSDEFLRDETGNRRFWVAPINTVDVRGIADNRDQIWAEAVQMLRDGEKWWCSEPWFIEAQENSSSNYMILDPWHEQIRNYVKNKERVFVNDVLLEVCRVSDTWTKNHRDRVCSTLRKLKFVRKRIKGNGGYFFTPAKATDREDEEEE